MRFLLTETPIDAELFDIQDKCPIIIALESRCIDHVDDSAIVMVQNDVMIEPSLKFRILVYSVWEDKTGFPTIFFDEDKENPDHPLWTTQPNSFSMWAIIKNEAIEVFKLVVKKYDKKFIQD